MSFAPAGSADGLENQLRGMILNHGPPPGLSAPPYMQQTSLQQQPMPVIPPHTYGAADVQQQDHLQQASVQASQKQPADATTSQASRRKPNQAQRRQKNAQLSIPVQSNLGPQGPQTSRGFFNGHTNTNQSRYSGPPSAPIPGYYPPQQPSPGFVRWADSPKFGSLGQPSPQGRGGFHQGQGRGQGQRQFHNSFPRVPMSNNNAQTFLPQQQLSPQVQNFQRPQAHNRQLFNPNAQPPNGRSPPFINVEQIHAQANKLGSLLHECISTAGVDETTVIEMESFRKHVESACQKAVAAYEIKELGNEGFDSFTLKLKCFGSMASGFASKDSDMDLALLSPNSTPAPDSGSSQIPRILEKTLLDLGFGARLLTKTRVPIIKLCQKPTAGLLHDLRLNHSKWEAGKGEEEEEADEVDEENIEAIEDANEGDAAPISDTDKHSGVISAAGKPKLHRGVTSADGGRPSILMQRDSESLGDYYSSAKKLLRKLGGKDIHAQHTTALTNDEVKIMTAVCESFIHGLSNEQLKLRLLEYPSLSFKHGEAPTIFRSLSGVYTQVEGERLTMAWETRAISLTDTAGVNEVEMNITRQIENWRKMCTRIDLDPIQHNRFLFQNVEQLRKVAVLQLISLEQGPLEHPDAYYFRASTLSRDFFNAHPSLQSERVRRAIIKFYIDGLRSLSIKSKLEDLWHKEPTLPLDSFAHQHQMLALTEGYKAGCKSGKYHADDRALIERYVSISEDPNSSIVVPSIIRLPELLEILSRLSTLPDPLSNHKARNVRDRYHDALEFPKEDIGIQCDINFSAQLALHNTQLMRCYSLTDPRVKPLILFVKHWAKVRGINTPYRGSLSSYGFVLMVLHYLVNIAQPFVCPNLQVVHHAFPQTSQESQTSCLGKDVRFWRNETEIADLAQRGMLNHNHDGIGLLLRGFYEYYAQNNVMSTGNGRGFDWGREVLSIRTPGGIISKQFKGWVGARTDTVTVGDVKAETRSSPPAEGAAISTAASDAIKSPSDQPSSVSTDASHQKTEPKKKATKEETKEIRHRYLFAIEDPFELDHNVARTVTHQGIVSIRDEFRRAWRLIRESGKPGRGVVRETEGLLDPAMSNEWKAKDLKEIFEGLHGRFD